MHIFTARLCDSNIPYDCRRSVIRTSTTYLPRHLIYLHKVVVYTYLETEVLYIIKLIILQR
jgi:hypothetical protein